MAGLRLGFWARAWWGGCTQGIFRSKLCWLSGKRREFGIFHDFS